MSESLNSTDFERLIERIVRTLEEKNVQVRWNERLTDVDVTSATRQIDILVERADGPVIVECRHHNRPQDMLWIEQLSAKRRSVGAVGVIAVSSSGFTETAARKAEALGVIVRDLRHVSKSDVRTWTNFESIDVVYLEFSEIEIDADIEKKYKSEIIDYNDIKNLETSNNPMWDLLDFIGSTQGDQIIDLPGFYGEYKCDRDKITINNAPVLSLSARMKARSRKQSIRTLLVATFGVPRHNHADYEALVERHDLSQTELITSRSSTMWTVDLSIVDTPKNCLFHDVRISSVRATGPMRINIVGRDALRPMGELEAHLNLRFI